MTEYLSAFVEDNDNHTLNGPHRMFVLSDVAPDQMSKNPPSHIEVQRCDANDCEIHARMGKTPEGIPTTLRMFSVPGRDEGYTHEARFSPFVYEDGWFKSFMRRGGQASYLDEVEVNGNDMTQRRTFLQEVPGEPSRPLGTVERHLHRAPELECPAAA